MPTLPPGMSQATFMEQARKRAAEFPSHPWGAAFLVPPIYGERTREALLAAGFTVRRKACTAESFHMLAWRVGLGKDKKARAKRFALAVSILFGTDPDGCEAVPAISGQIGIQPLVVPKSVRVEIRAKLTAEAEADKKTDREVQRREALAAYAPLLRLLAQITGKDVWFHSPDRVKGPSFAPVTDPGDAIHVVTNRCPPGKQLSRNIRKLFGMYVSEGESIQTPGPTVGRGSVLSDGDGTPVVQLVGNTWYLLTPTISVYAPVVSDEIFRNLLAKGWEAHAGYVTAAVEPVPRSKASEAVSGWGNDADKMIRTAIEKAERDIVWHQENIARLYREIAAFREFLAGVESTNGRQTMIRRVRKDIAALRAEPHVERVDVLRDALHVVTKRIVATEGGIRYDLGSFVIRVDVDRSVSVWTEAPTHPNGVQHPHIPKHDGPCLGNASAAILKAAGEFRMLDAVRYVIRWLEAGYQPDLACAKITEWPVVPLEESHA